MGRSQAKSATTISQNVADQSLATSKQLQTQAAPWLTQSGDYLSAVAGGDPTQLARYVGPQVDAARGSYDQARQQIDRVLGKGGYRDSSMANLENSQAGDVSRIYTGGVQDALSKLASLGSGGEQMSLQGLGVGQQSAQNLSQLAGQKAQAFGSGIGGLGGGIGSLFGGLAMRPPTVAPGITK